MSNAAATDYAGPDMYEVLYQRVSASGEVSDHRINIEAYKPEIVETIFHWRVDSPKDVTTQKIVSVVRQGHGGF